MSVRPTVLVIEPDPRSREATSSLLTEMGFQPWVAASWVLPYILEEPDNIAMVLCDWQTWLDVQEGPVGRATPPVFPPLVLVTHTPEQRERELARWLGAFDLVEPPLDEFTREQMRRLLAQAHIISRERREESWRRVA